jgi:ABC-type branched-subunit amino acid transport system substrate-binding protein
VPGAVAWAKWANAHGGVDGHRIGPKIYTGDSNATTAVANAHRRQAAPVKRTTLKASLRDE